jgi:endonuclease YncB( thermonuclease family)
LPISLWLFLILLLAIGVPAIGSSSAQSDDNNDNATTTTTDSTDNFDDDNSDLASNDTETSSSDSETDSSNDSLTVNDTETSSSDSETDSSNDSLTVNDTETSSSDATNIVINEVELNSRDGDSYQEWIELYNLGDGEVDIGGFEIRTSFKSATIQLPSDAVIGANEMYIVETKEDQMLSHTAESLALVSPSGEVIDRTPSLVDKSGDDRTWQRIPDGNNEWQFAAGTPDELNEPGDQADDATYTARSSSTAQCQGTAGCAEGMVTRIVDGDTLYIKVNGTVYKVDLALASTPSSTEEGFSESTSFTRSLCLGSDVLIDQDGKLLTSDTSVIAVVYCGSTNLNSELLDNGYATLDTAQCETSEFASQPWAKGHGC